MLRGEPCLVRLRGWRIHAAVSHLAHSRITQADSMCRSSGNAAPRPAAVPTLRGAGSYGNKNYTSTLCPTYLSMPKISIRLESLILPEGIAIVPTLCSHPYFPRCTASELGSELEQGCKLRFWLSATS